MDKSTWRRKSFISCLATMWLGLILFVLLGTGLFFEDETFLFYEPLAENTPTPRSHANLDPDDTQIVVFADDLQISDANIDLTWIDDGSIALPEPVIDVLPEVAIGGGAGLGLANVGELALLENNKGISARGSSSRSCVNCGGAQSSSRQGGNGFGGNGFGGSGGGGGGGGNGGNGEVADESAPVPEIQVAALPPESIFNPAPKFPPESPKTPLPGEEESPPETPEGDGETVGEGGTGGTGDGGTGGTGGGGTGGTGGGGGTGGTGGGGGTGGTGGGDGGTGDGGTGGTGGGGGTGGTGGGGTPTTETEYDPTEELPEVILTEYDPPYEEGKKEEEIPPSTEQEVPEPGALILFAMGLLGLGLLGRRRARA